MSFVNSIKFTVSIFRLILSLVVLLKNQLNLHHLHNLLHHHLSYYNHCYCSHRIHLMSLKRMKIFCFFSIFLLFMTRPYCIKNITNKTNSIATRINTKILSIILGLSQNCKTLQMNTYTNYIQSHTNIPK